MGFIPINYNGWTDGLMTFIQSKCYVGNDLIQISFVKRLTLSVHAHFAFLCLLCVVGILSIDQ